VLCLSDKEGLTVFGAEGERTSTLSKLAGAARIVVDDDGVGLLPLQPQPSTSSTELALPTGERHRRRVGATAA